MPDELFYTNANKYENLINSFFDSYLKSQAGCNHSRDTGLKQIAIKVRIQGSSRVQQQKEYRAQADCNYNKDTGLKQISTTVRIQGSSRLQLP